MNNSKLDRLYFWCLHDDCLESLEYFDSEIELQKHMDDKHSINESVTHSDIIDT